MTERRRRALPALLALAAAAALAEPPRLGVLSSVPAGTAVLLARGGEGGPLPIAVGAFPIDFAATPPRALVVVEVDGRALTSAAPGPRAGLELHLYLLSNDGSVIATRSEAISIDLAADGARLNTGGLRWLAAVDLPAGARLLRLHAREHFSGSFGQREVRLGAGGPPGVAVAAAKLAWVEVASPTLSAPERSWLEAAGGAPAAVPTLAAGSTIRIARWRAVADDEPLPLRVCDAAGRTLTGLPPRIEGSTAIAPGLVIDRYAVDLPADLSGRVGLAWGAGDPARALVRAGDAAAWNRMPALDVSAARTAVPPQSVGEGRGRVEQARAARESVLAAWRRFADGDREGAVAELLEAESASASRRPKGRGAALEDPAIARVAGHDPALLLPVSLLYLDLERAALAAGRLPAARRAREVAETLARRLEETAKSTEQRRSAATLYEALAAERIEARDSAAAAVLLERAARLAPERAAPWLTIGILFERDRVLDRARAAFDRVIATEPGHREARLRRARVDLLAGRGGDAGDELERLATERLDWIGVVAAEERTRQLLAEGRDEAAIVLLEPLVATAPQEASLSRALAYALERTGRRLAAREHVARAAAATSRPGTTPRKRYSEAPERLLLDRRVEVERAALLALPRLSEALRSERAER
ncbi:MAG: hypothetical protein AMXMBFR36_14230 [Acidobacteriota bacterium]